MKLKKLIKRAVKKFPNKKIYGDNTEITYKNAYLKALALGEKIKDCAVCAICCKNEENTAISLLACILFGVTAVPVPIRYGKIYCEKILSRLSPSAALTDISGTIKKIGFPDSKYKTPDKKPAFIMFTSGTTGSPKGIMLSEKNIAENVKNISSYFKLSNEDKILIARPLFHCAVFSGEFLVSLIKGLDIYFYSGNLNPKACTDIIENKNITVFCGTPTVLCLTGKLITRKKKVSLKKISVSGEYMNRETALFIKNAFSDAEIYSAYGLTEAGPRVSCLLPRDLESHPDSAGKPIKNVSVKILDKNGRKAKKNTDGEISVKSGGVMLGYFNDPEKTAETLKKGRLMTGDAGYFDKNGFLYIKGRKDGMINRAGMNVYPREIEDAIKSDPRVREVIAYGIKTAGEERIALKISGDFSSAKEVKKLCAEKLPSFEIPSVITLTDEIEKNGFGKIVRGSNHD